MASAQLRVVVGGEGDAAAQNAGAATLVTQRDGLDAGAALPAAGSLDAVELHVAGALELR
jgi:hypothetical protein